MLINHGADINARDNDGKTCLDYVQERIDAGEKDMEIVKKWLAVKECLMLHNAK